MRTLPVLPSRVGVVVRVGTRRGSRIVRARAAWLAVSLLAAACSPGGPAISPASPTGSPAASSMPSAQASPPSSAAPSPSTPPSATAVAATPEPYGRLVVALFVWGDTGGGARFASVYEDGRVIGPVPAPDGPTVMVERRLAPAGLAVIRAEVAAAGPYDHDRTVRTTPPGCCGAGEAVLVPDGERLVRVQSLLGSPATDARSLAAFDALVARLRGLLGASDVAWTDDGPKAYVAARFQVSVARRSRYEPPARPSVDVRVIAWPSWFSPASFASFGRPSAFDPDMRCGAASADEVRALATSVARLDPPGLAVPGAEYVGLSLDDAFGNATLELSWQPLLPDEAVRGC